MTKQDLLLQGEVTSGYSAGNVLVFSDKTDIALGTQLACADDLAAAREYLENSGEIAFEQARDLELMADSLEHQATSLEEEVARLTKGISQRDELLRDICDTLSVQREYNNHLTEQLKMAQKRLAVDELTREELIGDLQNVSEETHNIEITLEQTLMEKDKLEQELATSITEFIELNLRNDELQRHLDELTVKHEGAVGETDGGLGAQEEAGQRVIGQEIIGTVDRIADATKGVSPSQTITMSSGKQIHVYHEFPQTRQRSANVRISLASRAVIRAAATVLVVVVLAFAASVAATAQINAISLGEALDVLLGGLARVGS